MIQKIDTYIKDIKKLGITGHIRPDGDCVGSTLALYNYIAKNYPDKEVDIYLETFSDKFDFLPSTDKINYDREDKEHDIFIVIDVSDEARIGTAHKYFKAAKKTICIDHHISNIGFADENIIVPTASSASEVLYTMLEHDEIDEKTAECLYTGIVYDSGVFKHSNTSSKTMEIAGRLIDYKIPFSKIIDESFYSKTYHQNLILGEALLSSKLLLDGKVIYTVITREQMRKYDLWAKDLDGIVDQLRITRGVECAIFINEIIPHEYKISLRSNDKVNVNEVASGFGGGGHIKAAGCTIKGKIDEVVSRLEKEIGKQL